MRCVFAATPAYLGRVAGLTRCAFWAQDPEDHGFDTALLIEVDLARTPSAAQAKEIGWEQVQVDDCFSGPNGTVGGTTLGPRWPELRLAGGVYLERGFAAGLPEAARPACPPLGAAGRDYEFTAEVFWPHVPDPRAGARYAGHHAEVLDERGTLAKVAVYPPGRSLDPVADPVVMWIDLASSEQCDTGPGRLTTIGTGSAPKSGALFLISGRLPAQPQ
jgi:hypothetical protein